MCSHVVDGGKKEAHKPLYDVMWGVGRTEHTVRDCELCMHTSMQ